MKKTGENFFFPRIYFCFNVVSSERFCATREIARESLPIAAMSRRDARYISIGTSRQTFLVHNKCSDKKSVYECRRFNSQRRTSPLAKVTLES